MCLSACGHALRERGRQREAVIFITIYTTYKMNHCNPEWTFFEIWKDGYDLCVIQFIHFASVTSSYTFVLALTRINFSCILSFWPLCLFEWIFFFTWSFSLFVKTFVLRFPCFSFLSFHDSTCGFVLLFLGHVVASLLSSILLTLICTVLLMMFAVKNGFVLLFFFLFPSYFTPWLSLR